jgi:hypothetical protein
MTFVGTDGSTEAVVVIWIKNRCSPMVRSLHSDLVKSTCAPVVPAVVPAPRFVERVDMGTGIALFGLKGKSPASSQDDVLDGSGSHSRLDSFLLLPAFTLQSFPE